MNKPLVSTNQCEMYKDQWAMSTDNPPTAALCDHLLSRVFVAQHCAASVDRHQTVEALNGNFCHSQRIVSAKWSQKRTIQKRPKGDYSRVRHHLLNV